MLHEPIHVSANYIQVFVRHALEESQSSNSKSDLRQGLQMNIGTKERSSYENAADIFEQPRKGGIGSGP